MKEHNNQTSLVREMTGAEANVLNMIRNQATFEEPLKAETLRQYLALSKRALEGIIECLRVDFRHPIVAKKTQPSGYYLPKDEEERQAGLAPYRRQILTEQKNLAAVMSISLTDYWGEGA